MKTAVLHLVREPGESEAFLQSYYEHLSGAEHELFLVLKGRAAWGFRSEGLRTVRVSDFGRSLHALGKALKQVSGGRYQGAGAMGQVSGGQFDTVCFLNSFARIACDGWLERLASVARRPEVGAASCTVSLDSFLGNKPALWRTWLFPAWPNPHLRTNALCMRLDLARQYWPRFAFTKPLEHVAESGWWGLTNRLRVSSRQCVVVGAVSEHVIGADFDRLDAPCFKQSWVPMVTDNRCPNL